MSTEHKTLVPVAMITEIPPNYPIVIPAGTAFRFEWEGKTAEGTHIQVTQDGAGIYGYISDDQIAILGDDWYE